MSETRTEIPEAEIKACTDHAEYMALLTSHGVDTRKAYRTDKAGDESTLVIIQKED